MTKNQESLISETIKYVKQELADAEGGHDWWHIYRVWKTATTIAKDESANETLVQLAALLHDIADSKFNNGDEEIGPKKAELFLVKLGVDNEIIREVINIISNMSFKNTFENSSYSSLELNIVMDADRLDAIGAIGIARTFNYGGYKGSEIYNPDIKPKIYKTKEEYKHSDAPTINHFYEKLLLLKEGMTTKSGKKIAESRHKFMELFLDNFYNEWEGKP